MKIKNINTSLLILLGLLFLSFAFFVTAQEKSNTSNNILLDSDQDGLTDSEERAYRTDPQKSDTDGDGYSDGAEVKSGYNPLKPAPGDKLSDVTIKAKVADPQDASLDASGNNNADGTSGSEKNLTQEMANKISEITNDESGDPSVQMTQVQEIVASALGGQDTEIKLPEISKDEIKIKKQKYGNLSDEKAKEKKKEDFTDYIIALYYILASNSPEPITSASDLPVILTNYASDVISAISSRNVDSLEKISKDGEKILEQMKEVEVPEDTVDLHLKALSMAQYSASLKNDLAPKKNDPLGEIVGLNKIQNFLALVAGFSLQVQGKFLEYDITYDDKVKEKIKDLGLVAPDPKDLPTNLLNTLGVGLGVGSSN
jgi:hypothetical protein